MVYEVLSPWAENNHFMLLLVPFLAVYVLLFQIDFSVQAQLEARFGEAIAIERFHQAGSNDIGSSEDEGPRFAAWLEGLDAVIVAVGD